MELSEFLLARIAEDEAVARDALADQWRSSIDTLVTTARGGSVLVGTGPARVLAECDAKRRIVDAAWDDLLRIEGEWGHGRSREELSALNDNPEVVQLLALPYADHPDFDEAWRP